MVGPKFVTSFWFVAVTCPILLTIVAGCLNEPLPAVAIPETVVDTAGEFEVVESENTGLAESAQAEDVARQPTFPTAAVSDADDDPPATVEASEAALDSSEDPSDEQRDEPNKEPEQAEPEQGEPEQGEPEQGEPEQGEPEQGEPEQGGPEQGEPEQGGADQSADSDAQGTTEDDEEGAEAAVNPFSRRIEMPDFLPKDMEWLNTGGPLRQRDLKGKFVILDFWTYCCINCIHILPELKKLEKAYPNELVVIGVHSAKFEAEKGTKNIEEAILRYEIQHPVVNDHEHRIWNTIGVQSWPTVMLIDPEGFAVWYKSGEVTFDELDEVLEEAVPYYRQKGLLDETPIRFELLANHQSPTPLRFPGKVLADPAGNRLFITDSNHNRIVVTTLEGKLVTTIGSGAQGRGDGDFATATFDHPQGLALHNELLYVADTENHMIRKIDLNKKQVTTIAGKGFQGRNPWLGLDGNATFEDIPDRYVAKPADTALNSPWALWVHGDDLYIAMAGPHQIWKMTLDESEIGPYAGNGREDIVDGPLLPRRPHALGFSSFAQPSGLTSDGKNLFVADSEGSSIRAVPFSSEALVTTVVGSADLPHSRLFTFGDQDGQREDVLLQHALGVAYFDGRIFVADTYNNKIKVVDAKTGETTTIAGSGEPGASDSPAQFDEPAGVAYAGGVVYVADTNNHLIRTIEVATGEVATLSIEGLEPPQVSRPDHVPDFSKSPLVKIDSVSVKSADGRIRLSVALAFPPGWKLNKQAPLNYWLADVQDGGPAAVESNQHGAVEAEGANLTVSVPVTGEGKDAVRLSLVYYFCQEGGEGFCKMGTVVWNVPFEVADDEKRAAVLLPFEVKLTGP
jgi:DNA-binding beta-propeller fold protein YncE